MKILITLIALITLSTTISYSQQHPDSLKKVQSQKPENKKQQMRAYYKRTLNVDSVKAEQVTRIMETYKAGMNALAAEKDLSTDARRAKIKALIEEKNKKLTAILSPAQQARIIPGTERNPERGAKKD